MPQRFLKPGITSSERWNACSWQGQSFYIRLITLVDDFGRFEADPRLLRSLAFPLSEVMKSDQVTNLMVELHTVDLANFYRTNGKAFLQLTNWSERARAEGSKYPDLDSTCEQMFSDVVKSCGILPPSSSSSPPPSPPPYVVGWAPDPCQQRLNSVFRRKDSTKWSLKEERAYKAIKPVAEDELKLIEAYYSASIKPENDIRRKDLGTLLNNFPGEVDRARNFKPVKSTPF